MGEPKIFISHAYKDRMIVDAFVELLTKSGIDESQIIASSTPGTMIHTGKPLYTELKRELKNDRVFVIFMLSDNFYASKVCLNEMGAAWIMEADCEIILLPGFSFDKVKGVILEKNLVGISLNTYDKASASRFSHLRSDLMSRGFSLSADKWNLSIMDFFSTVELYKKYQIPKLAISMKNCENVCIGDDYRNGCQVLGAESSATKTTVIIDYARTTSSLCSIVYHTEINDWTAYFRDKKLLCFEIYTESANILAEVEMHIANGRNIPTPIVVSTNRLSYRIPLSQFTESEQSWKNVPQVCFLFRKDSLTERAKIIIENLRLEE